MMLRSTLKKHTAIIVIVVLAFLVVVLQKKHDDLGPAFTVRIEMARRNLLPPAILPYINFGFTNVITDYYWISAIQDFVAWNGKEGFFIGYFKNIASLDPRFEYPYLFSILTIPQKKDIQMLNEVAAISKKGMDAIPMSWQIPFYLGTQYYLFTEEYEPAESYLKIAASKSGAPAGASLLYATFVSKSIGRNPFNDANKYKAAGELVTVIYNNTDNEVIKELAGKGIQEAAVSHALQKGIAAYKVKYNKYPNTVDELVRLHFLTLPEELLKNFDVEIVPNGSFKIVAK